MGQLRINRSGSIENEKSIEKTKIGELVKAGVGRDGVVSPGQEKSSGVSSYNSEAGGGFSRLDQGQVR